MKKKDRHNRAPQLRYGDRRKQLIDCAIVAFAENGIGRANHAQVAKLAKVSVPTVFAYFPTRDSLVTDVLNEIERMLLAMVERELNNSNLTAFQKLMNILSNYADSIDVAPDMVKVFLDWTTSFEQYLSDLFQAYLDKLICLLSAIIEEGRTNREFSPNVIPVEASLMIYSSANILAHLKFHSHGTDISHYMLSVIASVLHLNEKEVAKLMAAGVDGKARTQKAAVSEVAIKDNRQLWQEHISGWQQSGLTQARYCKEHGIKLPSFSYWRKKLRE